MKNQNSLTYPGDMRSQAALVVSPRARRVFSALALAAVGLAALLPALAIGYWLIDPPLVALDVGMRMVAITTALLHLLPMSWGLWRLRAIEISSDVMILALFAGVMAALAWAMEKAAALAEENSQFV